MTKNPNHHPPQWPIWLLRKFLRPQYAEEIEGDLEERFLDDIQRYSAKKAKRQFVWQVVKLMRPALIKMIGGTQQLNNIGMLKNNFKTILRIIAREKMYTGINVIGLTAGISVALLILFYVHFELSYESYNPKADRIARITTDYMDGGALIDQDAESYHLLGPMMKEEFPEVEEFTRAFRMSESVLKVDESTFRASRIFAVDPSFLSLFGYPLIQGNPNTALKSQRDMILTESAALRYFGTTDIVGKTMWASVIGGDLKVVGIVKDSPANSHLKFDMLFSYVTMKETLAKRDSPWNSNDTFSYLLLTSADQFDTFNQSVQRLSDRLVKEDKIENERVIAQRMQDIHLYSHKSYELEANGNATIVYFLLSVALLVITIAIVNYINLATAKSMDRAKEVGIRKVIGSTSNQLKVRFFIESLVINGLSAILSLITLYLLLPDFKATAGLPMTFSLFDNGLFWAVFTGLILFSTLVAGSFPAFILSSFKPVAVLKGRFSHSSRGILLRKGLVVFQFAIAIFLLIQTSTSSRQLDHMQSKDLGLNSEQVVVVSAPPTTPEIANFKLFRNELLDNSSFKSVALSTTVPGQPTSMMGSTTGINLVNAVEEHNFNFFLYFIDSRFIPTMEFELLAGENFREDASEREVVVNEEAVKLWGISDPKDAINQKIDLWGNEHTIIGVLKNFHQTGVKGGYIPMIFRHNNFGGFVSIRTEAGDITTQLAEIESLYDTHFDSPFEFFFLDQKFDEHFKSDQQFQTVFSVLSIFALLITCLGLLGLSSFTVAKRKKEIGIRKVLGASVSQIITLISRDFIWLIGIASMIALPITYYIVGSWLNSYSYRIDITFWLFAGPAILVFLVAITTIFSRTLSISKMNPVNSLRDE
ncbi:ABC transporter permease [Roseivirga sp. 4D4]|uniref:ABC transporter permease n=1 Tax=Roseivirga sp. 4D4 TaxID=1889784 RepID=UPI0009F22E2F|nr:ABC transporter permease [Roseivirga sp. 4D4]